MTIREVYEEACAVLNNAAATEEELIAAAAFLRNEMYLTGYNTIAQNNQGVYINGRNSVIQAGDCFIFSPSWNNGLITVDNANIRYTLNVVFEWNADRQINVVKSISYGSGSSTPSIQLGESEWLVACHDWETGVAASDNPVEYSGTNYKILSQLSVGDAVKLSGCTALNANTYVEPAAFLKFIPAEATIITGENEHFDNGEAVLFTPDFNEGLLTHANANVHYTLNVIAQWDNAKSAWIVVDKFEGNGCADETSNIEIVEGQVLIACHVGDTTATKYNWNMLNAAKVGQQVIFSGVSPTDGTTDLSIAANVSFVDYADDGTEDTTGPENLALHKDYTVIDPGTAAHIANLTDGVYADDLAFTGEWFGFACTGDNQNTDDVGNGTIIIDLGDVYALDHYEVHIYAGENEASVAQPMYINIDVSTNGVDYLCMGSMVQDYEATASHWATLSNPGICGRYIRLTVGPPGNSTWVFINEVEVYGTDLTGRENIAWNTTIQGEAVDGYNGSLVNGDIEDWYGVDTADGTGSVVVDLGNRYQITDVLAYVSSTEGMTPTAVTVSVSADGTNYMKYGTMNLNPYDDFGYWADLANDAVVGQYVKLDVEAEGELVLISEVEVYGTSYSQSDNSNIAMGKETVYTNYEGSPFTALLNDGLASNVFQYNVNNSSWFAFRNSGDSSVDNVTVNDASTGAARGIITIDLGGQAEITDLSIHLFAGANDAGAVQPRYINVYYSTDGVSFDYKQTMDVDSTQTSAYWLKADYSAEPLVARYLKLAVGTLPGDLVLLNEIKVGGLQISIDEPNEPGTMSNVVLAGDFNNWNPTPNMMHVDDQKVTTTIMLEAGTYEFKVLYNNEWYGNEGTITDHTGDSAWVMDTSANNCTLTTSRSGQYAFTFDRETKKLAVHYVPDTLYLRGSFNNWGTDTPMTASGNGIYTATVTLEAGSYEYKVASDDYFVEWPSSNATVSVEKKAVVTFTLDTYGNVVSVKQTAIEVPTISMSSASLALKDEVQFIGYFKIENIDASTATRGLITYKTQPTEISVETAEEVIPGAVYDSAKDRYIGYSQGVPAKEMGDTYYIAAYAQLADGTYVYSGIKEISVKKYAYTMLPLTSDENLQKLLIAMLNYGAEAQLYFGYKTDELVDADLTDAQKNSLNSYSADLMDPIVSADSAKTGNFVYTEAAFSKRSVTVTAGGALVLNCRFNPAYTMDGDMTMYYWDAATYDSVDALTLENATGSAKMTVIDEAYQASVTGIAAKDIDKTIYVVGVYESDGVTYTTGVISYNLNTYFDALRTALPACQTLCEAAVVYCDYAKLYFLGE